MNASELCAIAKKYNRNKFRKDVIKNYKGIKSACVKLAKKGKKVCRFRFSAYVNYDKLVAVRLFRYKHRDFLVDIKITDDDVCWVYIVFNKIITNK